MLERLLGALAEGGAYSYGDLAKTLGVGEGLVHQMVEDLVRMGYLRPLRQSCEEECGGCSRAAACTVGGQGHAWALTEKGSKVVGELA